MEHTQSSIKDSSLAEIRDYVAYFLLFSIPFTIFALLFSLPPIIVGTQIRGHVALGFVPCTFYREKISALYSLVDSRRIVLTHARRSQQLILFFIFANRFKISPRRDSNSRTNTINSSIRGLPLVHRGDVLYCCTILLIQSM